MTENPIVKMASTIRGKVGTTKKFTLPEIATLMTVNTSFPDFSTTITASKNGASQDLNSTITVNGGDTIVFKVNYTVKHLDLLRKLVGTNTTLALSVPVTKYMDSDFVNKATSQTIHVLRQDGSDLLAPTNIAAGSTQYSYSNLYINQALTDDIINYLATNQPIMIKCDNIGAHDNLKLLITPTVNLWVFRN